MISRGYVGRQEQAACRTAKVRHTRWRKRIEYRIAGRSHFSFGFCRTFPRPQQRRNACVPWNRSLCLVGESFGVDISPLDDIPLSFVGLLRFLRKLDDSCLSLAAKSRATKPN